MELTGKDQQNLRSMIEREIHQMKLRRAELATYGCRGCVSQSKTESGRKALTDRITYLHNLRRRIGASDAPRKGVKMYDQWVKTADALPLAGTVVDTKIDEEKYGVRNEQKLKYGSNLWWTPDGGEYVYYKPTHWKYI